MTQGKFKQTPKNRTRRQTAGKKAFKPRSFFRREAEWMTWMNIAPFGVGVILALVFWFTR